MRRFFGKLINFIRQTNKARPAQKCRRRALLQLEELESRQLLSTSPVTAAIAAPLAVFPLTPIQFKYQELGGASGILGKAVTGELPTPTGGGRYEQFEHGNIYWSASTGAHDVYGPILNEYVLTATEHDANGNSVQNGLGLPTTDVFGLVFSPSAAEVVFQGGAIYSSDSTGAHAIVGGIYSELKATENEEDAHGNEVFFAIGLPTSDEMNVPGVAGGRMNTFAGGAAIYWSQATGAHVIYGAIATEYNQVGGPAARGLPNGDEAPVANGIPDLRATQFAGNGYLGNNAAIYWTATTGAHLLYGPVEAEYLATFGETDYYGHNVMRLLGAPTSDALPVGGTGVDVVSFQGDGKIYLSAVGGAHVVYGPILDEYLSIGGPMSPLGPPMSDEISLTTQAGITERITYFEHGWINWNPVNGRT